MGPQRSLLILLLSFSIASVRQTDDLQMANDYKTVGYAPVYTVASYDGDHNHKSSFFGEKSLSWGAYRCLPSSFEKRRDPDLRNLTLREIGKFSDKVEKMTETEDLVLSLSLRSPVNQEVHSASTFMIQNNHWQDIFVSDSVSERTSVNDRAESRSFLNGIDMNRIPAVVDFEEEAGISSTNSTISCVSGKRSGREENETERTSDEEDGETSRKKLRLSKEQSAILEESFKEHNTLNPKQKLVLAKQLNLRPRQVEVWFQNRRARTKLKQTEVDCEYLKRCCEKLTEENRRLHREVHELKAMKCVSPHSYMRVPQPTTLTMCHSCHSSNPPTPSKLHHPTIPMVPWTMGRQHHRS